MKVTFFLSSPNPVADAGWTRISYLASYFHSKGHEVAIVGIFTPTTLGLAGSKVWRRVSVYNLCPYLMVGGVGAMLANSLFSILTYVPFLFLQRPSLVFISVPSGDSAVGAYLGSRVLGAKVITDYRDEWEDYLISRQESHAGRHYLGFLKAVMSALYAKSAHVVAVTRPCALALKLRGIDAGLLSNGADVSVFRPRDKVLMRQKLGLDLEEFLVVYSGGLVGYYRVDFVLKALSKLKAKSTRKIGLVLVGKESGFESIMGIAESLGVQDRVVHLGEKVEKEELAEVLCACDVGVVPYDSNPLWRDALPAKFFEYCACGLPVVVTAFPDSLISQSVRSGMIGLTANPMDVEGLSSVIDQMASDSEFLRAAGLRARSMVVAKYDRRKIAQEFLLMIADTLRTEELPS